MLVLPQGGVPTVDTTESLISRPRCSDPILVIHRSLVSRLVSLCVEILNEWVAGKAIETPGQTENGARAMEGDALVGLLVARIWMGEEGRAGMGRRGEKEMSGE